MYINKHLENLFNFGKIKSAAYSSAKTFPHIEIDNLFDSKILEIILNEFPNNLEIIGRKYSTNVEQKKYTLKDSRYLSVTTNNFLNFLNSQIFLSFLQSITNIKEKLIPDPYLDGGGLHELKNGGYLNIHADFNKHPTLQLDRRLNVLIYLNKNWKDEYGGNLQLWDKEMTYCEKRIFPLFNKTVIFSTTYNSYHGNPDKISCPPNMSRKSLALYYYTNGRPDNEKKFGKHSTIFRNRPGTNDPDGNLEYKKIFGKFYYKKKNKI